MNQELVKKKRGRPAKVAFDEMRDNVRLWTAGGISQEAQAKLADMSVDVFVVLYANEFHGAADFKRGENLQRLQKAAAGGNVSAMKYMNELLHRGTASEQMAALEDQPVRSTDNRIGKREERLDLAIQARMATDDVWGNDLKPGIAN
jgi:AT hook motif